MLNAHESTISTQSTQSKKPKKYAGQAPPDTAFYASTFDSGNIGRQSLIRGLHIDNPQAREIDGFIDQHLQQDSPHSINMSDDEAQASDDKGPKSRLAKFYELELDQKTHFTYDIIYTALIREFECFREAWREENQIPWSWHNRAIRMWVRNNRRDLNGHPGLRDGQSGYKRKYLEEKKAQDQTPAKRTKKAKKKVKLLDKAIVVYLCCRVKDNSTDDPSTASDGKTSIKLDPSGRKIRLPMYKVMADPTSSDGEDERYLDNGDVNPDALDLKKLLKQCEKLGEAGEGSILAYSKGEKVTKIRDDSGLSKAVRFLHAAFETDDVLEMMFAQALAAKTGPEEKGDAFEQGQADKENREPAEVGRAGNSILEFD